MPYELYWCELPEAGGYRLCGTRPVVVISNEKETMRSDNILVIPVTTHKKRKDLPVNVKIEVMGREAYAKANEVSVVPKKWLGKYIGRLNEHEERSVKTALMIELGFL